MEENNYINNVIISLLAILVIIVGIFAFKKSHERPVVLEPEIKTGAMDTASTTKQQASSPLVGFRWTFSQQYQDDSVGIPQTKVTYTNKGETHLLGTFDGTCSIVEDTDWSLLPNESTGVICWFAGAGTEIGLFREGYKFEIRKGNLDEGDAETPGMRGEFTTLVTL